MTDPTGSSKRTTMLVRALIAVLVLLSAAFLFNRFVSVAGNQPGTQASNESSTQASTQASNEAGAQAANDAKATASTDTSNQTDLEPTSEPGSEITIESTAPASGAGRTIMVLGDSISAAYGLAESSGWVHLLATALKTSHPQSRVVNASVSGETTTGGLQRLPDALNRFSPDIVIIELGGNDGLRGQSLELMRSNLSAMIALTIDAGAKPILVGMRIPPNYGKVYADGFHQTFIDVATEKTIPLVPFLLEPIAEDRRYFQPDGIHPTAEAQPLLLEQVLPTVDTLMSFTE